MVYNYSYILLDSIWWRTFEDFCIYIHKRYWSVVFSLVNVLEWFCYWSNIGLTELVGKYSFLFYPLEESVRNFLFCLAEATREDIWAWAFLCGYIFGH